MKARYSNKSYWRPFFAFKIIFAILDYASTLLPKPHRSIFAQFGRDIVPLRVETGRRKRVTQQTNDFESM